MADKYIKVYLTDEEYEAIKSNAQLDKKTLSGYIKDISISHTYLNPINIQTEDLFEHSKQIELCRQDLNKLITNDLRYKEVYQKDIKKMMSMLNDIEESENAILSTVLTTRKKVKQEAIKILKKQRGGKNGNNKNSSNK